MWDKRIDELLSSTSMYRVTYTYMPLPTPTSSPKLFASSLCSTLDLIELLRFFRTLPSLLKKLPLPEGRKRPFYDRLFNPWLTLWAMVLQRLLQDHTLENA